MKEGMKIEEIEKSEKILKDRENLIGFRKSSKNMIVLDKRRRNVGENRIEVRGSEVKIKV